MSRSNPARVAEDPRLERIRHIATVLDGGIRVPGTGIRIGLDPILGLIPGLGDGIGALMASSVFIEGVRRGVSRATLLRMALNIALDFLIGAVPVLGDVFDFAWKANLRNVALLERDSGSARRKDRLFVAAVATTLLLLCGGLLMAGIAIPIWLLNR